MTSTTGCPEERGIRNRKNTLAAWNRHPVYRAAVKAFLEKHPWCVVWLEVGVKVPAELAHHTNDWSYASFEIYCDLENNGAVPVSGKHGGGHYAAHHNQKICPICKKKKCNIYAEGCQDCLRKKYPGVSAALDAERERKRVARNSRRKLRAQHDRPRHPCGNREKYQGCKLGKTCNYSWKRARACGGFAEATA